MNEDDQRPTKRVKTERLGGSFEQERLDKNVSSDKVTAEIKLATDTKRKNKSHPRTRTQNGVNTTQDPIKTGGTFTQPSAISSGDKGIFVSSDKGREKKCLLELHDIVQEYLGLKGIDSLGCIVNDSGDSLDVVSVTGIEDDIAAELSSMRGKDTQSSSKSNAKPLQLITLDVPCVSFLRFPPGSSLDPVDIVHNICLTAMDKATPQSSRFVKRLTPVLSLGKTLNQGLQKACDEVLPRTFGPDAEGNVKPCNFAIRPTIRNNDKLNRDETIKTVASRVQEFGQNMHGVDLKQYEKGILVEVYRGWVAMSVVDNNDRSKYRLGFEELKRFNLAEIYASR